MMASFFGGFLQANLIKILIAVAVTGLIVAVFLRGEASGRHKAMVNGLQRKLNNVERANEIEREVDRMSGTDVADELRERWSRD